MAGDTKYGTIENIKALEDAGIRAYVPLPDWEHQRPYFGPAKFSYDAAHDRYVCPQGQSLRPFHTEYKAEKVEYRAEAATCNACPLKAQCTPSDHGRQVHRSFHASYLERVRSYHQTQAYQKAMRKRKVWVEPLFAEARVLAWSATVPLASARAASTLRPCGSRLDKTSNACSKSEDGGGGLSQ